jgi:hypothetical protein
MIRALMLSLLVVLTSWGLVVVVQVPLGWTFLADDPGSISTFLSSLAQFAAIPVTIAFGVIVLIIQQQATAYTSRAGALVVGTPGFMFVVALLFEVPALCILLLGVLDLGGPEASRSVQALAGGVVGPVLVTFVALGRFSSVWFGRISPAEFSGFVANHVERLGAAGWTHTSSLHETKAKEMKDASIDFSEAARKSREMFEGYWIIRFQDPDSEEQKALRKIEGL